jgi:hypothetical protein
LINFLWWHFSLLNHVTFNQFEYCFFARHLFPWEICNMTVCLISFTDGIYHEKFATWLFVLINFTMVDLGYFYDLLLIEYPYINKMSNYNPDFFLIKIINKCLAKKQYSNWLKVTWFKRLKCHHKKLINTAIVHFKLQCSGWGKS